MDVELAALRASHMMIHGKYLDCLLSGRKRVTIRRGIQRRSMGTVYIHAGGRIVARARVVGVEYRRVRDLTDEDAANDCMNSRDDLLRELRSIYRGLRDDEWVTLVWLEVEEPMDVPDGHVYMGVDPVHIARLALAHLRLEGHERAVLERVAELGSIRRAAREMYGDVGRRGRVRRIVRRALRRLVEAGVLPVGYSEAVG